MLQFFKDFKFSNILRKERGNLLCLDIGSASIKAVEVVETAAGLQLESFHIVSLPDGCMNGHQLNSRDTLTNTLKDFVYDNNFAHQDAALILSGPQVVVQTLKVPTEFADNQLMTHIELEADKYLPFNVADLALDFDVLNNGAEVDGNLEVLLAAAKKDYVNDYMSIIKSAKLNLRVIDVYSCVMGRLSLHVAAKQMGHGMTDKVVAIVDIGHEILSLSIFKNERQVYLKEQNFGGKNLTMNIKEEHSLDEEIIEKMKLNYENSVIATNLDYFRGQIARQLYHMMQFFYASAFADEVDYLFLVGGMSLLPGLDNVVEEKVRVKTKVLDPFSMINPGTFYDNDAFKGSYACLTPVCGLALRSYLE